MNQFASPRTPTRQSPPTSSTAPRLGPNSLRETVSTVSQSTPAASPSGDPPASSLGEPSFGTSSGEDDGSIVLHSLSSNQTSGTGIESSFEALDLGHARHSSTDSSLEIIVHSSPGPTTGFLAFSQSQGTQTSTTTGTHLVEQSAAAGGGGTKDARHSRHTSLVAIDEKKELALLNPVAPEFALPTPPTSTMNDFQRIVLLGKDEYGQLTTRSKEALARLGLKPVPSLHGPLNLPYARCASGIDAFLESDNPDAEPWGDDGHDEGGRSQRTLPIPLPGNSRYTQAGRLAMRYSSAPATLESGVRRSNRAVSAPRVPPPVAKPKKANSPARPPQASPSQNRQQAKSLKQRPTATVPLQQTSTFHAQPAPLAQLEMDAQAFAQAQAMQAFFIQQAHLAQVLGGKAAADFLAAQTGSNVAPKAPSPRVQSPFLPAFQPFSPPTTYASPPLSQTTAYSSNQVDSLTLLKLAGQRQLGLNFPLPTPLAPLTRETQFATDSASAYPGHEMEIFDAEGLGGRQAEQDEDEGQVAYNRTAVPLATTSTPGGTGYDFLRRGSSHTTQDRQDGGNKSANRRNSSSTRFEHQDRPSHQQQLAKPPQETKRRRSAAPAMPYPGHSHRNPSTSSTVVTVNSSVVPQVRIFSDPSSPTQRRRSMASTLITGRPLEDVVNAPLETGSSKTRRLSAAEESTNWRDPLRARTGGDATELASPVPKNAPGEHGFDVARPEPGIGGGGPGRGRGAGGKGRKRGARGRGQKASGGHNNATPSAASATATATASSSSSSSQPA